MNKEGNDDSNGVPPEPLHTYIEPEIEARVTAFVLGEASDFEREELDRLMHERPEVAMLRKRLEAMHGMLREVAKGEPEDQADEWKLSEDRRSALLAVLEGKEAPVEAGTSAEEMVEIDSAPKKNRGVRVWLQIAAILIAAAMMTAILIPNSGRIMEKEKQRDLVEHWAWQGEASSFPVTPATPTAFDSNGDPVEYDQPGVPPLTTLSAATTELATVIDNSSMDSDYLLTELQTDQLSRTRLHIDPLPVELTRESQRAGGEEDEAVPSQMFWRTRDFVLDGTAQESQPSGDITIDGGGLIEVSGRAIIQSRGTTSAESLGRGGDGLSAAGDDGARLVSGPEPVEDREKNLQWFSEVSNVQPNFDAQTQAQSEEGQIAENSGDKPAESDGRDHFTRKFFGGANDLRGFDDDDVRPAEDAGLVATEESEPESESLNRMYETSFERPAVVAPVSGVTDFARVNSESAEKTSGPSSEVAPVAASGSQRLAERRYAGVSGSRVSAEKNRVSGGSVASPGDKFQTVDESIIDASGSNNGGTILFDSASLPEKEIHVTSKFVEVSGKQGEALMNQINGVPAEGRGRVGAVDGTIALGAGGEFLLSQEVPPPRGNILDRTDQPKAIEGQDFDGDGTIEGASMELKAQGTAYALAINNSGSIRASGATGSGGVILTDGGTVNVGSISANNADGSGGEIVVGGGFQGKDAAKQDDFMIDLNSAPEVVEFEGFINLEDSDQSAKEAKPGQKLVGASRYVTRLQDRVVKADEAAVRGQQLLADGDLEGAISEMSEANRMIPDAPVTAERKKAYVEQLAAASTKLAKQRAEEGAYEEARTLVENVLAPDVDPQNADAKALVREMNDPEYHSPALAPENRELALKLADAHQAADGYAAIGDFEKAEEEYFKTMNEDRYNTAARRGMEAVDQERMNYYDAARDQTRAEFVRRVADGWELPVPAAPIVGESGKKSSSDAETSKDRLAVQWSDETTSFGAFVSGNAVADTNVRTSGSGSVNGIANWVGDETAKLKPNVHAGNATWDTPLAEGDVDRDLGRFKASQKEWQRYPGHPASTNVQPAMKEIMDLVPQVVGGGSAEGRKTELYDVVVESEPASAEAEAEAKPNDSGVTMISAQQSAPVRLDYGVPVGGEEFELVGGTFTGGMEYDFKSADNDGDSREAQVSRFGFGEVDPQSEKESLGEVASDDVVLHVGHGQVAPIRIAPEYENLNVLAGVPLETNFENPVREFKEGIPVEANLGQVPSGISPVTAGLRSGAQALDGDSIDGLISQAAGGETSGESPAVFGVAGVYSDPQFSMLQEELKSETESLVDVGSRYGDTEVTAGRAMVMKTAGQEQNSGFLGFREEGQTWAEKPSDHRVALPAGIDETDAADEAFSTFSLHVSDVSFKLAQAALAKGEWPDSERIRIEEFVNAFDYGDPMPGQKDKVACVAEQAIHPFLQQRNLLRVSMRTAELGRSASTPLRLTLLLDNSGSMDRADRQETVSRALAMLSSQLQAQDQVTLISFARQPRLLADAVTGDKARQLVETVAQLPSEGGTNLEAALKLAFEKAKEHQVENSQNRIVLLTDGAANLGDAEPENLAQMIESMRNAGIAFDAAGIGAEGLNDEILEALTRKGDGRYYLLDRPEDADDGFARQIAGALRPAAMNVKVQVEFNPDRVGKYKLIGFEKHRLEKEDFRNDSVDAAEMAAAEAGVAVYQFEPNAEGEGDVGSVSVRFRDMASGQMIEKRWPILYAPNAARPDQAAPSLQLATIATQLGAKLKGGTLGDVVNLDELASLAAGLPAREQRMERVQQLRQMIDQARELEGGR